MLRITQALADSLDITQFFRRAPREWLQRYFEARRVLSDFDWQSITIRGVEALKQAWLGLGTTVRSEMIEDFANIKMLATPAGKVQMIDEAPFHGVEAEVAARLSELDDVYACAFWLMLEQKKCWNGAVFYAAADGRQRRYWRKRINLPVLGRLPTDDDGKALAEAITDLFRQREGRGDHCVVHQYRRGKDQEREYYFAYPQDHKLNTIQFHEGVMTKRPYSPAFEIIFVHNDAERTLSIWHEGKIDRVKDLQVAFAKTVLGQEIDREKPGDDRVYDLACFLDPGFRFEPTPELGIANVEFRKIGLKVRGDLEHTVSIELGPRTPNHVLVNRIEAATRGIPQTMVYVARVGCRVTFEKRADDKRAKTRSFELVWPSSCSLQNDSHGVVIQRMLADHGIEPRRPDGGGTDGDQDA